MIYWFFLILFLLVFITPIFAQASTSEFSNMSEYILNFDGHTNSVSYLVNASIIEMSIDPESKSLLIGLDNSHDSKFIIDLEHELISAQNDEFIILVDGKEADYDIKTNLASSVFTFFVTAGTEEVEIIGTHVIPEFPSGIVFGFTIMILSAVIFAKIKAPFFKL